VSRQAQFYLIFPSKIPLGPVAALLLAILSDPLPPFLPTSRYYPRSISSQATTISQSERGQLWNKPIRTHHLMTQLPPLLATDLSERAIYLGQFF